MGLAAYNMTKWGVVGFSEALRQEGQHIGIRVSCIEPGYVDTELQGHNQDPIIVERLEQARERIGRSSRPTTSRVRWSMSSPSRSTSRSTRSWSARPASSEDS